MLGTLENLLAIAHNEVGDTEHPPGSNVPIMKDGTDLWEQFYGLPYEPHWAWCALFASYCDWKNGTPLPPIDFSKGYIGVDNGRAWFARNGLLVPRGRPGYLCFYNEHTGRQVSEIDASGWFWAIEGNEGDAVRLVHRHISEIVGGFGVRTYDQAPATEEDDVKRFIIDETGHVWVTDGQTRRYVRSPQDYQGLLDVALVTDKTVHNYPQPLVDCIPIAPGGDVPH